MSSSDFPLRDQQDIPIWNAVDAKNFKQAIKAVEKRIKKKSTDYLEALRIFIQSRPFSPETERSHVIVYVEKLRDRSAPLTDLDAIELLDEALASTLPDLIGEWAKTIGELRLRYVTAKPKDEEGIKTSFKICLLKGDLDHAEKIANVLQKSFPDKHAYHFWSIATKFLYAQSDRYAEEHRTTWGRLAFAFISKMAGDTQKAAAEGKMLPVRSIHTPQEILLLHLIAQQYGTTEKRLQYLDDPSLGAESAIAKGDWQLWRWKIELMTVSQQWKGLFEVTSGLLVRARTKDSSGELLEARYSDWIVWEAFLRSAKELSSGDTIDPSTEKIAETVIAEVKAHLHPDSGIDKSWRRNASLARLKYNAVNTVPFLENLSLSEEEKPSGALSNILDYIKEYGSALTGYDDLRPVVELLSSQERRQLKDQLTSSNASIEINTSKNITKAVTNYKLLYLLTSSIPEHELRSRPAKNDASGWECEHGAKQSNLSCGLCLSVLALSTTQAYGKSISSENAHIGKELLPTDRHPADDLVILSAMCLIKSSATKDPYRPEVSQILRATMLLEYAWSHSKSNFQISLLLIKLYAHLGCGSLAMRAYQRLGAKQIQHDTLSFTILDRISSLHPHPFSHTPESISSLSQPMEQLVEQQRYYALGSKAMLKNIWRSFQEGSYNSIFQITEAHQTLNRSVASITSVIETGRTLRLLERNITLTPKLCGYDVLTPNAESYETTISDTNSYDIFPDFECTASQRFVSLFPFLLPETSKFRVHANFLTEKLILLLSSTTGPTKEEKTELLRNFERLPKKHEGGFEGMTLSETITVDCTEAMIYIMNEALESSTDTAAKDDVFGQRICAKLQTLQDEVVRIETSPATRQPDLQLLYMAYDLASTVLKFSKFMNAKHLKLTIADYKEAAIQLITATIAKSTAVRKKLDEGGLIDWVVDALYGNSTDSPEVQSLAESINDLIGDDFREVWAGEVAESWKDSIDGLSFFHAP